MLAGLRGKRVKLDCLKPWREIHILYLTPVVPQFPYIGGDERMIARLKNWFRRGGWSPLLELALIAALGISLAHWTWIALAPRAVAASVLSGQPEGERLNPSLKRNLFGVAPEGKANPVAEASPASGMKLLGVLSRGVAGAGRAIFALDTGKPKTVEAGSQIAGGLVLKEVHSDYVLIARNGSIERMKLDRRAAAKN